MEYLVRWEIQQNNFACFSSLTPNIKPWPRPSSRAAPWPCCSSPPASSPPPFSCRQSSRSSLVGKCYINQHYFLLSISDEEGISDTSSIKVNISETARYQEWRQTFIVLNEKAKIRILSSPCPKSYSQTPQVPISRALTKNLKSKKEWSASGIDRFSAAGRTLKQI